MAAPSTILVPNVWNPSSNRYLIISPLSSSESLSAQLSTSCLTAMTYWSLWLQQSLQYLRIFVFSDGFLKIDIFPNSFLMKKAYQHDNFFDQLLRLLLRHSKMLLGMQFFKYTVTYLLDFELSFKYFWFANMFHSFQSYGGYSGSLFRGNISMLLESTVTGFHFLVSIFVGLLDCGWFITSLKWNVNSDDTGFV